MVTKVIEVYSFNDLVYTSWGGAVDTLKIVEENEKEDDLLAIINDILGSYDGGLDRTALNDYLWFDRDEILSDLGIDTEE